ncbi:MAG TPA: metal-dependent hydrolase [Candidatus Nanoarchaeia archaeon]|nr:metal-dependent hydrolase [Candidatus Nanoarchaeia archaeon]
MPQAVTHFIFSLVLFTVVWSCLHKKDAKIPLAYVLLAGLAGLLPDIDYALFWIMYTLGYLSDVNLVHRIFTHSLVFPLAFGLIAFVLMRVRLTIKHRQINAGAVLAIVAFGSLIHIALDAALSGYIRPLYPFSFVEIGTGLLDGIEPELRQQLMATFDGLIFVLWITYLALTKSIQRLI